MTALVLPSHYPLNRNNLFGSQGSFNIPGELYSDAKGPYWTYFGTTPRSGFVVGRPHQGSDFLSPLGGDVFSVAPGLIMGWLYDSARGYHILQWFRTKSGGQMVVCYQHLQNIRLEVVGTTVPANHHIGESGASGVGTGPHLHVEPRVASTAGPNRWNWQAWPAINLMRIVPGGDLAADPRFQSA